MLKKVISRTRTPMRLHGFRLGGASIPLRRRTSERTILSAANAQHITSPKGGRGTSHPVPHEDPTQPTVPNASSSSTTASPSRIRIENNAAPSLRSFSATMVHSRCFRRRPAMIVASLASKRRTPSRALLVAARPLALLACELRAGTRPAGRSRAGDLSARGGDGDGALSVGRRSNPAVLFFRAPSPSCRTVATTKRNDEESRFPPSMV